MTRLLQEQVDRLAATVESVVEHGVTDAQRKKIAAQIAAQVDGTDDDDTDDDGSTK